MKILNFGSCNTDYVYSLDHIVSCGETEQSGSLKTFPGGKGLNQSIAIAKAGGRVFHAGCIGEDGKMLADVLEENGVDISNLKQVSGRGGHAVIQVGKDGENSIIIYPGSNAKITAEFIDSVLEKFDDGDFILLQNEINNVDLIIKKAYEKGMRIILNPSPCNDEIGSFDLEYVEYLILNEIEAKMLSSCSEAEASLEYLAKKYPQMKIVLTLGKNGSVLRCKEGTFFQAAFCVEAVDTTAAGDTFTGYFIAKIAENKDFAEALRLASAASAIAVSREGAAPSIPNIDEVFEKSELMEEYTKNDDIKTKIDNYLESNLKKATAKGLAEYLGYSAAYTQSLVKKHYGEPVSKIIQDKCCRRAAKMLKETELSAGEIINIIGYENESFFRKIFKEKYGMNMLKYKKTWR